jgi:tetratricopeptide (TPR) repeat protein
VSKSLRSNSNASNLLREAMTHHQQDELAEADVLYGKYLKLKPEDTQALRLRGILARQCDSLDSSLVLLQRAAELAPGESEPHGELGLTYMAAGDLEAAEHSFHEALARDSESQRTLTNLGALLQFRGRVTEAIPYHRRALQLNPGDVEVLCNLAKALADAGQLDESLETCNEALEISNQHPYVNTATGAILCDAEKYTEAAVVIEQALAGDPNNDMALINLAYAQSHIGDSSAAIVNLRLAANTNPSNARAVADLAGLLVSENQAAEASYLCEGFLLRHPGEPLVVAALSWALYASGQTEIADELLDYATLVHPITIGVPTGFLSLEEFNAALVAAIQNHPSLLESPGNKSTRGGKQTGELNFDDSPALTALGNQIRLAIKTVEEKLMTAGMQQHPAMVRATDNLILRAWGTVLPSGGQQIPHIHPVSWLSGVYYVQVPDEMLTYNPESGNLEFGVLPEQIKLEPPPPTRLVKPVEGQLVIFPSYMHHATRKFEAKTSRISIAFDAVPKYSIGLI